MNLLAYIAITSFFQVNIPYNSLVVLDIDETTLQFPNIHELWWKERHVHYKRINGNDDLEMADNQAYNEWLEYVKITDPMHTDKHGLFDLFQRVQETNSDIIFLTARFSHAEELTVKHLKHLGIEDIPIYFTSKEPKGYHLDNIVNNDYLHKENIIVIDDMNHNLHSIKNTLKDKVQCFKFVDTRILEHNFPSI